MADLTKTANTRRKTNKIAGAACIICTLTLLMLSWQAAASFALSCALTLVLAMLVTANIPEKKQNVTASMVLCMLLLSLIVANILTTLLSIFHNGKTDLSFMLPFSIACAAYSMLWLKSINKKRKARFSCTAIIITTIIYCLLAGKLSQLIVFLICIPTIMVGIILPMAAEKENAKKLYYFALLSAICTSASAYLIASTFRHIFAWKLQAMQITAIIALGATAGMIYGLYTPIILRKLGAQLDRIAEMIEEFLTAYIS